jgi:membrane protein
MNEYLKRAWDAFDRGRRFVTHDVWHIGLPGEEVPHGFIIKQVRVAILLVRSLMEDVLLLRASALTFTTILSLVPFLAVTFFVIQTFNLDSALFDLARQRVETAAQRVLSDDGAGETPQTTPDEGEAAVERVPEPDIGDEPGPPPDDADTGEQLKYVLSQWLFQNVAQGTETKDGTPLENPVDLLINFAEQSANPSALGITGIAFVFFAVFGLMRNIESSFNGIWGLKRTRSWYRMLSDYVMIMLLLPFVAAGVLGVTVALASDTIAEMLGPLRGLVRGTQFVIIWLVFTILYQFVPNTRVKIRYSLLGGFVASSLWLLTAWAYVAFQFRLANYSLVYSGFAQFPLLLMWIYSGWVIVLFGAELTFAYQNEKTFAMERLAASASHAYREALGLRTMLELAHRFDTGASGLEPADAAERWNVPTRLLNLILDQLEDVGLVRRSATDPVTYQPARSIDKITVRDVLDALRESGRDPSALREDQALLPLLAELKTSPLNALEADLATTIRRLHPPKPALPVHDEPETPALPET